MRSNGIAATFLKTSFVPFCIAVFSMIAYDISYNINHVHEHQKEEAKRIAHVVALTAAQTPIPTEFMAQQVDTFLKYNPTLSSIDFYPLSKPLDNKETGVGFFDAYLNQRVAVMVANDNSATKSLIGYINVTMDLNEARQPIIRRATSEFMMAVVGLSLLAFALMYVFGGSISVMKRLRAMTQKVLEGDYDLTVVEYKRSRTWEFQQYEDALMQLTTKLRQSFDQLSDLQKKNSRLMKHEQSINYQQNTFQSLITHELRTPLNAISGGIQLLEPHLANSNNRDSFHLIQTGHLQLSTLLDRIIELNNLQQGNVTVSDVRFDPEALLRKLAEKYSQECLQRGLTLSISIKHKPINLLGAVDHIEALVDHLLDNAVKFTDAGRITLTSNLVSDADQILWHCHVEDTGVGIDPNLEHDIFKAYVQADVGNSRAYEGSGLGLTLANKLVELLHGKIVFQSKLGEGSRFSVSLPLKNADQLGSQVSLNGLKIVHVHTGKTAEVAHRFRALGAHVQEYSDLAKAQAFIQSDNVDIITLCSHLSPQVASQFASLVRENEFTHRSIIVYFKLEGMLIDELWLHSSGIDHWLPFGSLDSVATHFSSWFD